MNARSLLEELGRLGVELRVDGGHLEYEGPEEAITAELLDRLTEHKPSLIKLLEWERRKLEKADRRGLVIRRSKVPGYLALHDPTAGEWHDFPAADCFPSMVAEATDSIAGKGGTA